MPAIRFPPVHKGSCAKLRSPAIRPRIRAIRPRIGILRQTPVSVCAVIRPRGDPTEDWLCQRSDRGRSDRRAIRPRIGCAGDPTAGDPTAVGDPTARAFRPSIGCVAGDPTAPANRPRIGCAGRSDRGRSDRAGDPTEDWLRGTDDYSRLGIVRRPTDGGREVRDSDNEQT